MPFLGRFTWGQKKKLSYSFGIQGLAWMETQTCVNSGKAVGNHRAQAIDMTHTGNKRDVNIQLVEVWMQSAAVTESRNSSVCDLIAAATKVKNRIKAMVQVQGVKKRWRHTARRGERAEGSAQRSPIFQYPWLDCIPLSTMTKIAQKVLNDLMDICGEQNEWRHTSSRGGLSEGSVQRRPKSQCPWLDCRT